MPGPWEKYGGGATATPAAPAQNPFVVPPDPMRVAQAAREEARRVRDQQLQEGGDQRAAAAAAAAQAAAQRSALEWTATHNPDGSEKINTSKPTKGTEDENKSSSFYRRASRAAGVYDKGGLGPRSMIGQGIAENMWGGEGFLRALPDAVGDSPERQNSEQAKRDFATSLLRSDSGANAPEQEVTRLIDTYFPRPNETDPSVLANYAAARKQALDALRARSGVLANGLPEYVAPTPDRKNDLPGQPAASWNEQDGLTGTVTDEGAPPPAPSTPPGGGSRFFTGDYSPAALAKGLGIGLGNIAQSAGDLAGVVGNPLNATINYATGSDLSTDLGGTLRDDILGAPHGDPMSEMIQRGGAGALMGSMGASGAAALANPGALRSALTAFASAPRLQMAAGATGGGSSEFARENGAGVGGQILAGVVGGALGAGGASAAARIRAPRLPTPLAQAASRQNVRLMPADVGGPATRMATGVAGMTLGGIPLAEGAQKSLASAAAARNRVAAGMGDIADPAGAGQAAQRGARQFIQSSEKRGGDMFERISVNPKALAETGNTRAALAEVIGGMESNPDLSKLWTGHPRLKATLDALTPQETAADQHIALTEAGDRLTAARQKLAAANDQKNNLATPPQAVTAAQQEFDAAKAGYNDAAQRAKTPPKDGTVSWEDMKRLRSVAGQIVGKPSLTSDGASDAAMRKFYGALTQDMEATATAAGPRALSEFRRANQYWRGRQDRIDNVLSGILGSDMNKAPEAAFKQVGSWSQKGGANFGNLARAIRSMPADEANTVRASVFARMGNAKAGVQSEAGDAFSPATFSTEWHSMDPRAKSVLFQGDHRRSVDDIVKIMDGMKHANDYANTSKTALGVNSTGLGITALSNPILAGTVAGGQFLFGKAMASPKLARWLAKAPATGNPQVLGRYIDQLGPIAARDAAIGADARALQEHLRQTFGLSPVTRAAAGEEEKKVRREEPRR